MAQCRHASPGGDCRRARGSGSDYLDQRERDDGYDVRSYYDNDAKTALRLLLDDIASIDQFAAGLETKSIHGPGLYIHEIGSITLPLAPEVTAELHGACQSGVTSLNNKAHTIWQLEPTVIAASNADWRISERNLCGLACDKLGLSPQVIHDLQLRLRKVVLTQDGNQYEASLGSDTPSHTFARALVLPLSPKMGATVAVQYTNESSSFSYEPTDEEHLACVAFYKECTFELQPGKNGCCVALEYDLNLYTGLRPTVKTQSWYVSCAAQLARVLSQDRCIQRSVYMLDLRYTKSVLQDKDQLTQTHRQVINILQHLDMIEVLEVYIAWVEQHEISSARGSWSSGLSDPVTEVFENKFCFWQRLDGSEPTWRPPDITRRDTMLQGASFLKHLPAAIPGEEDTSSLDGKGSTSTSRTVTDRRRYHVALLMFPPQKRWHVYCQAGPDAAIAVLNKFIAKLPAGTSVSPAGNSLPLQLAASDASATSQPAQDPVAIAGHCQAVAGMIDAIWDQFHETDFQYGRFDIRFKVDGYGTFADAAQAFGQPEIAFQSRKCKLQDECKADWTAMARAAMPIGQSIRKRFPEISPSQSTKKADSVVISDVGRLSSDSYALHIRMICSYSNILRALTLQATSEQEATQKVLLTALENTYSAMVTGVVRCAKSFPIAQVLAPACLQLFQAHTSTSFAGSPGTIKLMAACMCDPRKLQKELRHVLTYDLNHKSTFGLECQHGKVVEAFLKDPKQTTLSMCVPNETAVNIKWGILGLENCDHNLQFHEEAVKEIWFKKVSLQERQEQHERAVATVVQAQEAVQQAIVGLFIQSGRPPPENHAAMKLRRKPKLPKDQLYNLWLDGQLKHAYCS